MSKNNPTCHVAFTDPKFFSAMHIFHALSTSHFLACCLNVLVSWHFFWNASYCCSLHLHPGLDTNVYFYGKRNWIPLFLLFFFFSGLGWDFSLVTSQLSIFISSFCAFQLFYAFRVREKKKSLFGWRKRNVSEMCRGRKQKENSSGKLWYIFS